MVIGIGIDVERLERFHRLKGRPPHLIDQVYSQDEQRLCWKQLEPVLQFAAGFALKEAVFKALGQGWLESALFWADIELLSPMEAAQPHVRLRGAARARLQELGGSRVLASFSHSRLLVIAQVLITAEPDLSI